MHKFKIIKGKNGFRVQFVFRNEVMFWTESYTKKTSAMNAIKSLKAKAVAAPIEEVDETVKAVATKKVVAKKAVAKVVKKVVKKSVKK